jgi:hypothetical protein
MTPPEEQILKCPFCYTEFHYSNNIYIPRYKITACNTCYTNSRDGWPPQFDERFIELLKANDIPIPRKKNGYYPRD